MLVLLAIVGLVSAVLLYNALGSISKRLDANATNLDSFRKLDDALARYVMLNQRLPCPANGTAHTGVEDPNPSYPADPYRICNSPSGVVPWATLGLSQKDATDSWGRYIAYRVYDGASGFTQSKGLALADCLDEQVAAVYPLSGAGSTCNSTTHENAVSDFFVNKGLTVNDRGSVKTQVAYALISMGESGLGAYYPGGAAPMPSPDSASKEFLNAGSGGTYWITTPSDPSVQAASGSHFDDVVSYAYAAELAHNARLAGHPWPLNAIFTLTNAAFPTGNFNSQSTSWKFTHTTGPMPSEGPVMVTAAADIPVVVCVTNTTPQGVAPCSSLVTDGSDRLDTTFNERLAFDFRVTRKVAIVQLSSFRVLGGGGTDKEQARITFYNGATQVYQKDVQACATGSPRIGQFTITPGADFTRVEVRALNSTGSATPSRFEVSAIMACKVAADCVSAPAAWTPAPC